MANLKDSAIKRTRLVVAITTLVYVMGFSGSARAQADCRSPDFANVMASAERALAGWERARGITLTEAVRGIILRQFCSAATELIRDQGVESEDLSQAAGSVLTDYLNENASGAAETRPLGDLLARQFSLGSGPIIPGPRALGRIRLTYRRHIDFLQVGTRTVRPSQMLISEPGRLAISGHDGGQVVCHGVISVEPPIDASFIC